MLVGGVCHALLHMNSNAAFKVAAEPALVSETPLARQTDILEPSSCTRQSQAYHTAVECTPVVGAVTNIICPRTSVTTITGCGVFNSAMTSTKTLTITAQCDSAACGGGFCDASPRTGTAQFPSASFTPPANGKAVRRRSVETSANKISEISSDQASHHDQNEGEATTSSRTEISLESRDTADDEFWLDEWGRVDPEVHLREAMDDDDDRNEERWDTHSSSRVRAFGKQGFNMGVRGLMGCTSVIVVSRRGVWMSHIWEIPSFTSRWPECPRNDIYVGVGKHQD